ncbi:MAG: sulfotransferase [Actinomycetota bacterium]|nr:sulfotransferase [Actinomycetota bacterium]
MTADTSDRRLSVAELIEEAAARAGEWEVDVPFAATLGLLVESSRRSGALNDTGQVVLQKAAVRHLRNLRQLESWVAGHPEVADIDLGRPVVVTGLPRTGTTLLHHLLSLDPAHRVLRFWEALHPVPSGAGGPSPEARQAQAGRWLDAFYRLVPDFQAVHRATPTGPEECDALLQNTFASQHFDDMFDAPDYSTWLAGAPLTDEYRHFARQLRVLSTTPASGSPVPGGSGGTWALKSPSHLGHLDALLDALPGATVVLCHRRPHEAVASYASLIATLRRAYSNSVSPATVGGQALTRATTAMQRALDVRDTTDPARFVDISYPALVEDPIRVVRAVYRRLGRQLAPAVEEEMQRWVLANPRHKHGAHRYDLARFGLTPEEVDAAFERYTTRFGDLTG